MMLARRPAMLAGLAMVALPMWGCGGGGSDGAGSPAGPGGDVDAGPDATFAPDSSLPDDTAPSDTPADARVDAGDLGAMGDADEVGDVGDGGRVSDGGFFDAGEAGRIPNAGDGLFLGTDGVDFTQLALYDFEFGKVTTRVNFDSTDLVATGIHNCIRFLDRRKGFVWYPRNYSVSVIGYRMDVNEGVVIPTPTVDGGPVPMRDGGVPKDFATYPTASIPGPRTIDFVTALGRNDVLAILGLNGLILDRIDLSALVDPGDTDRKVDAIGGIYDDVRQKIFVVLARYDRLKAPGETDLPKCDETPRAIVVAIDPLKLTLTPFPGGDGVSPVVPLDGVRPVDVKRDATTNEIVVLHAGCNRIVDGGPPKVEGRGIEALSMRTAKTRWLATANDELFPRRLTIADAKQYVVYFGPFGAGPGDRHVQVWDPTTKWPGRAIVNPPITMGYIRDDWAIGVQEALGDGGKTFSLELLNIRTGARIARDKPVWSLPRAKTSGEAFGWP